jgi:hypothetical protein
VQFLSECAVVDVDVGVAAAAAAGKTYKNASENVPKCAVIGQIKMY